MPRSRFVACCCRTSTQEREPHTLPIQDVTELDRLLDELAYSSGHDNWDATLPEFSRIRKPNADGISDLSHGNYHEMRSHVQSKLYLIRTAVDRFIHRWVGDKWLPLYQMVRARRLI